ncbi:sensor histidine kinase [Burkholderia glumae]|uniref:sensor histidine kinase n=1 Tax=Burkholderia glumae TaxID=337 RepID=UPI002036C5C7|nr:sensor histidine kinase [Burkholderia glumae]MCM2496032.1 ATP-binding protein [Burkholderia glumae]
MTAAHFRFSPRILVRLGEELNQSADQSILELVKNAYDADARRCSIVIEGASEAGGSVIVADDGDGMSAEDIRDGWLVLGKSSKSNQSTTRAGRYPAGSKGLGRLSALRLGQKVDLVSIVRGNSRRLNRLHIDWDAFEKATTVEEVDLTIEIEKNDNGGHGTKVELRQLRMPLRENELRRLARSLLLLTDPFEERSGDFVVMLSASEFKEIEQLLKKKYFDDAEYHLVAQVDQNGYASAKILDWKGNTLAEAQHTEIRRVDSGQRYVCPPAAFDFWVFLLSRDGFNTRLSALSEIRAWLNAFGGVHIYENGIRVAPYGNARDDWLGMNLSRARSPEERPSTNTSIGRIKLSNSGPFQLRQKTDRSGYIEDPHFQSMHQFAADCLEWLAKWRTAQAEKRRGKEREEAPKAIVQERIRLEDAIAMVPPSVRPTLEQAFSGYERSREREAENLRKDIQLYRTLSTAGIVAATFAHESHGNPIKVLDLGMSVLQRRIPKLVPAEKREEMMTLVRRMDKSIRALATLGTATLNLVKSSKRRPAKISIHETLRGVISLFAPFTIGRDANVIERFCDASPYLRASEAALESIIANLLNNSLNAFRRHPVSERIIEIRTDVDGEFCNIHVLDNGPGIRDVKVREIWLPGITTDPDGTGLGLTIVRDTVKDLGGHVSAIATGDLGGAHITISLPILGAK